MTIYLRNILISLDQLLNVLIGPLANRLGGHDLWGSPDETISSVLGKLKALHGGHIPGHHWIAKQLAAALDWIDRRHVEKSIEEDEGVR